MPTFHILSLPFDALFHIFKFLSSNDLFSINLTCRALHKICLDDGIWRQASTEIPLDTPLGKSLRDFAGRDLRKLYVKEARLREYWANDAFKPGRWNRIPSAGLIIAVNFKSYHQSLLHGHVPGSLGGAYGHLSPHHDEQTKLLLINSITKQQFSARIPAFDSALLVLPVLRFSQDLRYFVLVAGSCNAEKKCPEQLIHVYDLPPNIASTTNTSPETTTNPIVQVFDPELRNVFQSSHFEPSSSDTSVMPPDVALDPQGSLFLFQPEVSGNGAHITEFRVDPPIELIQTQKIARSLFCRRAGPASSLRFQCACPNRGFFGAEIMQPNGDALHQLYRFSHQLKGGGVVLVPLEEFVQSEIVVEISHDDASGRLCVAVCGSDDIDAEAPTINGFLIIDLVTESPVQVLNHS